MHTVLYAAVILLGLVMNHQCAPVLQSEGVSTSNFVGNPQYNIKKGIVEGDIVEDPRASRPTARGVAVKWSSQRWSQGIVPYEFAGNHSVRDTLFIERQMRAIETLTMVNNVQCVQFRRKTVSDPHYLTIFNGSGCSAPVGSWGTLNGIRPVSLLSGLYSTCMIAGIVQHELTHALGLYHEQSRPDRDTYVTIQWSNIEPAYVNNFVMYNYSAVDTLMTLYDYGSVMHYERDAFAINPSIPTIIPLLNSSAFIGQRVQLSPIDILEIQRLYDCVATPNSTTTASTPAVASTTSTIATTGTSIRITTATPGTTIRENTTTTTTKSTVTTTTVSTNSTQTASKPSVSKNAAIQHVDIHAIYLALVLRIVHFTL